MQALTLLNDTGFHEFTQGLAGRLLSETPDSSSTERADYLFRICLARGPTPGELQSIERLAAAQLDQFKTHPRQASDVLTMDVGDGHDRAEMAAWTTVSGVLMNLDEFITRE